jgi:Flp pilus assembly protein TadG
MIIRSRKSARKNQGGAVLVEMALVTPILLFMMLATAEVTRVFIDHNTLTKSVRNGVRHLSSHALFGTTGTVFLSGALQSETRNLVVFGNTAGAGTPVLPGLTTADVNVIDAGSNNVTVTVSYGISGMLGAVLRSFHGGSDIPMVFTLEASTTMRSL